MEAATLPKAGTMNEKRTDDIFKQAVVRYVRSLVRIAMQLLRYDGWFGDEGIEVKTTKTGLCCDPYESSWHLVCGGDTSESRDLGNGCKVK